MITDYSLPVLCGKMAATRQLLISSRADSKLRRLHDIYMLQCADVHKLERYRYTRWKAACRGSIDGDNLSWYETATKEISKGTCKYQISTLQYTC